MYTIMRSSKKSFYDLHPKMAGVEPICPICGNIYGKKAIKCVKRGAIETLIQSSKQRNDNKWTQWVNSQSLQVHIGCSIRYNYKHDIAIASTKHSQLVNNAFNFSRLCVICGEECGLQEASSAKMPRARPFAFVEQPSTWKGTILAICESGNNAQRQEVKARVESVENLSAVHAKYHLDCYSNFRFMSTRKKSEGTGCGKYIESFERLFDFLEESKDNRWSLNLIENVMGDPLPSTARLAAVLYEQSGGNIVFRRKGMNDGFFTRKQFGDKNLATFFVNHLPFESEEECKKAVLQLAAQYLRQDIQSADLPASTDSCHLLDDTVSAVPVSLKNFLGDVFLSGGENVEDPGKKIIFSAHTIMAATKPDFNSTLQLGISRCIGLPHQPQLLVDSLSKFGVCAPYSESDILLDNAKNSSQSTEKNLIEMIYNKEDWDIEMSDEKDIFTDITQSQ